ncbi:hypothetical protein PF005_g10322 [Phytophthora fragariae]|uniref:Retrotransposon gag domain-containing protein n=1 Tax=Phytophthora fragariae TaxID=53985 RepID=A0A6A3KRI0_9STRA|nr:hypothetical protein PF003_g30765 [Phytophthora fragariae]KAE9010116.1 hypothetical protein PF011_g9963 [Phytophthora fragariae]KAE9110913.1 hypothetical protein PF007_g11671 [Phytophthora fragariae]KAE9113331.1 hypothetical protein PF006_g19776 [Phytophthora fragariae]KAE9213135.1 hypothetical protein PF005_g10322 [Phytophthora fragariae]
MESVVSQDHPELWEYDPDDLDIGATRRTAATAAAVAPTGSPAVQRVKISAISDLQEFAGKDRDEERAGEWISKVKSAFTRDQATDEEKCLTFADLLTGPARNWYRQLSRSTRTKWSDLLQNFQTQYCGLGVSVAWQYYHARKRSEETPLEYLHRLNVAGMRARLKIKDGDSKARLEHVEHFIESLGGPDRADQLTLLRLGDADQLEDVLRARERAKSRQKKSTVPSKYRPKPSAPAPPADHTRAVRTIQVAETRSEYGSDPEDSRSDGEHTWRLRAICHRRLRLWIRRTHKTLDAQATPREIAGRRNTDRVSTGTASSAVRTADRTDTRISGVGSGSIARSVASEGIPPTAASLCAGALVSSMAMKNVRWKSFTT